MQSLWLEEQTGLWPRIITASFQRSTHPSICL